MFGARREAEARARREAEEQGVLPLDDRLIELFGARIRWLKAELEVMGDTFAPAGSRSPSWRWVSPASSRSVLSSVGKCR